MSPNLKCGYIISFDHLKKKLNGGDQSHVKSKFLFLLKMTKMHLIIKNCWKSH
jgi:hypothetical protein